MIRGTELEERMVAEDGTKKRLLLITASSPEIQRLRQSRVLNFQQITMPYLAAYVPTHWTILHVDEAVEAVDLELSADLVAITFHTPSAPHVYELAARFRQRGVTVALGGPHVTRDQWRIENHQMYKTLIPG